MEDDTAVEDGVPPANLQIYLDTLPIEKLPRQCTGCGALTQLTYPDQPGYFNLGRKAVRKFLGVEVRKPRPVREEEKVAEDALKRLSDQGMDLEALGLAPPPAEEVDINRMCNPRNAICFSVTC